MNRMNTKEVVAHIDGGQAALAKIIGIKQPSVSYRVKREIPLSVEEAILIEASKHTNLTRHQICPDIFGPEPTAQ